VHKAAAILSELPPSVQKKTGADLHAIGEAENRSDAEGAFDRFLAKYGAKYDKAAHCPAKDRAALLAFDDVPAEHWKHVRSTKPVESTFATVRLRTAETQGCL
jgi:putative transposase